MEQERRWYVIGMGAVEDFDEGRGGLLLEERGDEIGLPVFMTPELLERYTEALMVDPDEDPGTAEELRAGRYRAVNLEGPQELASTLAWSTADSLFGIPPLLARRVTAYTGRGAPRRHNRACRGSQSSSASTPGAALDGPPCLVGN